MYTHCKGEILLRTIEPKHREQRQVTNLKRDVSLVEGHWAICLVVLRGSPGNQKRMGLELSRIFDGYIKILKAADRVEQIRYVAWY